MKGSIITIKLRLIPFIIAIAVTLGCACLWAALVCVNSEYENACVIGASRDIEKLAEAVWRFEKQNGRVPKLSQLAPGYIAKDRVYPKARKDFFGKVIVPENPFELLQLRSGKWVIFCRFNGRRTAGFYIFSDGKAIRWIRGDSPPEFFRNGQTNYMSQDDSSRIKEKM